MEDCFFRRGRLQILDGMQSRQANWLRGAAKDFSENGLQSFGSDFGIARSQGAMQAHDAVKG